MTNKPETQKVDYKPPYYVITSLLECIEEGSKIETKADFGCSFYCKHDEFHMIKEALLATAGHRFNDKFMKEMRFSNFGKTKRKDLLRMGMTYRFGTLERKMIAGKPKMIEKKTVDFSEVSKDKNGKLEIIGKSSGVSVK